MTEQISDSLSASVVGTLLLLGVFGGVLVEKKRFMWAAS
jgi:hypothetical protein